jgi:predicted TIM-barrel fold metal-dependent hydrolase
MRIVDFHSHFFSAPFFRALAERSPLPGDVDARLAAVAKRTGIELPSPDLSAHLARWIGELDKNGVEHLCTFASDPAEIPAVCEAASMSKGRLSAFAVVDPKVAGAAEKIRGLLEAKKIRGVLLFPAMHGYRVCDPEARPLIDAVAAHDGIVFVHCGVLIVKLRDLLGLPRPMDLTFADPLFVIPTANAFPRARFVIPHFGAGMFRETLMAGSMCGNVFVDTSSSNTWTATQAPPPTMAEVFERALEVFGPERILFGTDSNAFPAGWRADRLAEQREALGAALASEDDREKVFGGNARRLLLLG